MEDSFLNLVSFSYIFSLLRFNESTIKYWATKIGGVILMQQTKMFTIDLDIDKEFVYVEVNVYSCNV